MCVASYLLGVCVSISLSLSSLLHLSIQLSHSFTLSLPCCAQKRFETLGAKSRSNRLGHTTHASQDICTLTTPSPAHYCMREITRRNRSNPPLAIDARPSLVQQASKKAPSQIPFVSDGVANLHTYIHGRSTTSTYSTYHRWAKVWVDTCKVGRVPVPVDMMLTCYYSTSFS